MLDGDHELATFQVFAIVGLTGKLLRRIIMCYQLLKANARCLADGRNWVQICMACWRLD
jgi:hypothetical protein